MGRQAASSKASSLDVSLSIRSELNEDVIRVRGARQHNLKNVDVTIPRNKMVVFTGVSGSGKSSLAFDTIFAEGQRRYVESLSAYARQFLGQVDKPMWMPLRGFHLLFRSIRNRRAITPAPPWERLRRFRII